MWEIQFASTADKAFFSEYVHESIDAILRNIIVVFSSLYLMVLLFTMIRWPDLFNWPLFPVALLIFFTATASYWFVPRSLVFSQVIWQFGMALAIVHTAVVFSRPEILFLMSFLPMVMVIALGLFPAVLSEFFILAFLFLFSGVSGLLSIPPEYIMEIGAGGFLGGVLGWAFGSSLFTVSKWSLQSYREARQNLEEVRQHRGHLARLMKDLDQAYHRLEQTNAALTNAWRKADEAERLKTEFVLNVSHELRTPLNLIIGFSEVISRSPESYRGVSLPSAYRRDVNAIYNSARHLLALIDDVLDLGRIDAGRIMLMREEVSPAALTTEVVDMVREYIQAKGLELRVSIQENLPELWIDDLRIRQAVLNLLANAARFTSQGYIRLEVFQEEAEIIFRVQDSGAGIAEADLSHVFELFHTTDQPADEKWHAGAGLGLPVSKKFVEMHGGSMGVTSVLGEGSTFWFKLPCTARTVFHDGLATTSIPPSRMTLQSVEHNILVVDSDPAALSLLQHHLSGFRFSSAPSLAEGLALAEEMKAIAVIADPAQAGQLQQSSVPIVHFPWPTRQQAAASLGAKGFLTKPVSSSLLLSAIDSLAAPVRRMLIADSDPELVRLFQRMLRVRLPIQNCLEAFNYEEVIQRATLEHPDLVVMDLSLLRMDGGPGIRKITEITALEDIPVILISEMNWEDLCLRLPGTIQVYRPDGFELAEIVQSVDALLKVFAPGWNMEPAHSPAQSG